MIAFPEQMVSEKEQLSKEERYLNCIYCFNLAKCKFWALILMQLRSFLRHWCNVMERAGIEREEKNVENGMKKEVSPRRKLQVANCGERSTRLACGYHGLHPYSGNFRYSLLCVIVISHQYLQWAVFIAKVSCLLYDCSPHDKILY